MNNGGGKSIVIHIHVPQIVFIAKGFTCIFKIFDIKDVDSTFLEEFHRPYKMVLSESMAEKIYKDKKDIHGEILKIDQDNYEVNNNI